MLQIVVPLFLLFSMLVLIWFRILSGVSRINDYFPANWWILCIVAGPAWAVWGSKDLLDYLY